MKNNNSTKISSTLVVTDLELLMNLCVVLKLNSHYREIIRRIVASLFYFNEKYYALSSDRSAKMVLSDVDATLDFEETIVAITVKVNRLRCCTHGQVEGTSHSIRQESRSSKRSGATKIEMDRLCSGRS